MPDTQASDPVPRMIITCPSCSSRYPVDAASFEPSGRKVRCAKCGNSWHQAPSADLSPAPAAASPVPGTVPRKKIFGEKPSSAKPVGEDVQASPAVEDDDEIMFADTAASAEEGSASPVPPAAGAVSRAADIGNRFRAEIRRAATMRRGKVFTTVGWVVLVLFVGGTLGAGYAWRHEIAAFWPATTKVYAVAGQPINLRGFEFRNVAYERQTEEGLPVLAITGDVVNVSGARSQIPRLRVALLDDAQTELYHWTFALSENELPAGEGTSFVTRLSSPPPEARDIEVRFVSAPPARAAREVPAGTQTGPATATEISPEPSPETSSDPADAPPQAAEQSP
ncbi:MAG: zinc-ribbon domain-containing protein [Parvibaculum sp.]|nr:zinc-ribbon domain-containing protein [Parvibaculum sp.]